jgi:hypothetical protein
MFTLPHDRHVDRVPADARHASFGKVLPFDIARSVKISVNLIATGEASENRLCWPVPLVNKPAFGTPLRRVTGINSNHARASLFGLVGCEGPKLSITPSVVPSPLFAATLLSASADIREVFNDDNASRLHALNDTLAQNVVAIFPKPCLPPSHLLKMAFSGLAAFGLKLATKTEVPFFNLLPSPLPKELPVGQNGGSVDAKINANGFTGGCYLWRVYSNNDIEPPTGRAAHKVGTVKAGRPVKPSLGMAMKVKRKLDATFYGRKANKPLIDLQAVGSHIIPNRTPFGMWSTNFLALLQHRENRLNSLCRFHARRNHQLAWKCRMLCPKIVVRRLVQRDTIPDAVFPTVFRDRVEAVPTSRQRSKQDGILFWRGVDTNGNGALHSSYMVSFLLMFKLCCEKLPH